MMWKPVMMENAMRYQEKAVNEAFLKRHTLKCQGGCPMVLNHRIIKTCVILWCLVCFGGFQSHSEAQTDLLHPEMLSGKHYEKSVLRLFLSVLKSGYTIEERDEQTPEETDWISVPYLRYMRAYILQENRIVKPLRSMHDFQGFVQVDTLDKAIEFVRFRTSLTTYYLFRPHVMIEVFQRPSIWELERLLPWGDCAPKFFEQHHLNNLKIVAQEGYFEIQRYLLAFPWEGEGGVEEPILYKTIEKVYKDGRYIREQEQVLEGEIIYHNILYPMPPM